MIQENEKSTQNMNTDDIIQTINSSKPGITKIRHQIITMIVSWGMERVVSETSEQFIQGYHFGF